MPISETENQAVGMAPNRYGGEIKPDVAGGVAEEETGVYAALVFLQQNPGLGRVRDVGIFRVKRNEVAGGGGSWAKTQIARSHEAVHGITAHRGHYLAIDGNAWVGRAMIDGDALVVRVEFALADQVSIAGLVGLGHVTLPPHVGIDAKAQPIHRIGLGQEATIIVLVHHPTKTQLPEIGKASGALGLNLGFA